MKSHFRTAHIYLLIGSVVLILVGALVYFQFRDQPSDSKKTNGFKNQVSIQKAPQENTVESFASNQGIESKGAESFSKNFHSDFSPKTVNQLALPEKSVIFSFKGLIFLLIGIGGSLCVFYVLKFMFKGCFSTEKYSTKKKQNKLLDVSRSAMIRWIILAYYETYEKKGAYSWMSVKYIIYNFMIVTTEEKTKSFLKKIFKPFIVRIKKGPPKYVSIMTGITEAMILIGIKEVGLFFLKEPSYLRKLIQDFFQDSSQKPPFNPNNTSKKATQSQSYHVHNNIKLKMAVGIGGLIGFFWLGEQIQRIVMDLDRKYVKVPKQLFQVWELTYVHVKATEHQEEPFIDSEKKYIKANEHQGESNLDSLMDLDRKYVKETDKAYTYIPKIKWKNVLISVSLLLGSILGGILGRKVGYWLFPSPDSEHEQKPIQIFPKLDIWNFIGLLTVHS